MTKDEQDALVFLSQTHRALHDQRVKRSFKVVVSTLTLAGLCVAARFAPETKLPIQECVFRVIAWFAFAVLFLATTFDLLGSRDANVINEDIARRAENSIIEDLKKKQLLDWTPSNENPRKDMWFWEAALVFVALCVCVLVITF